MTMIREEQIRHRRREHRYIHISRLVASESRNIEEPLVKLEWVPYVQLASSAPLGQLIVPSHTCTRQMMWLESGHLYWSSPRHPPEVSFGGRGGPPTTSPEPTARTKRRHLHDQNLTLSHYILIS